jgi:hypothetical protein
MLTDPCPGNQFSIPKLQNPMVRQQSCVPAASRITCQHRQPNSIDANVGFPMFFEDVVVDPTGPGSAHASGRGEKDDESRMAKVVIEGGTKLGNVFEVVQPMSTVADRSVRSAARHDEDCQECQDHQRTLQGSHHLHQPRV